MLLIPFSFFLKSFSLFISQEINRLPTKSKPHTSHPPHVEMGENREISYTGSSPTYHQYQLPNTQRKAVTKTKVGIGN